MNKVTPALNKILMQNTTREFYNFVTGKLRAIIADYRSMKEQGAAPESIAYTLQQLVDHENKNALDSLKPGEPRPICKKGCSHCCYIQVDAAPEEAVLIAAWVAHNKIPIDMALLRLQAKVDRWQQLPYKARKCVFLSDSGECGIYKVRPISCRKYFVGKGDPEKCNSQKYPKGEVLNFTSNLSEVIASGLYSESEPGILPRLLLEKLEGK